MATDRLQELLDKEDIRTLALLYSRAIDRRDTALLRDLYTADATDTHGNVFDGPADAYCAFIDQAMPAIPYCGHHICNHLIEVDSAAGTGSGEVYAIAMHILPNGAGQNGGGQVEDILTVRYLDHYRRCADGKWRFAKRVVSFDMHVVRPYPPADMVAPAPGGDPSYGILGARLFQPGARG